MLCVADDRGSMSGSVSEERLGKHFGEGDAEPALHVRDETHPI